MSTVALTGLLEYLYHTLSPSNMRWVGEHLIEYSKKEESEQLRPYTMQEIDEMLDEAEIAFEAGDYLTNDEVFHHKKAVSVSLSADSIRLSTTSRAISFTLPHSGTPAENLRTRQT